MFQGSFLAQTLAGKTSTGLPFYLPHGANVQVMDEGVIRFGPRDPQSSPLHLVISCGVHGNETAPVELAERLIAALLSGELRPRARVLFVFGNVAALRAGTRFVKQDMNRLFCRIPEGSDDDESRRATMLELYLMRFFSRAIQDDAPRLHYDLHTAIHGSQIEKFAIYPRPNEGINFQPKAIARLAQGGVSAVLLQTTTAPTFSYFSSRHCGATAFTVELGRAAPFGQNAGIDLSAMEAHLRALISGDIGAPAEIPAAVQVFRVSREIIKRSEAFELFVDAKVDNFTPLQQGSLLARDGDQSWTVDEAEARIIFPNPEVAVGQRAGLIVVPSTHFNRD